MVGTIVIAPSNIVAGEGDGALRRKYRRLTRRGSGIRLNFDRLSRHRKTSCVFDTISRQIPQNAPTLTEFREAVNGNHAESPASLVLAGESVDPKPRVFAAGGLQGIAGLALLSILAIQSACGRPQTDSACSSR